MKVNKMLSPEEQTIVANIQALVSQLQQMSEGGESSETQRPFEASETLTKGVEKMDMSQIKKKIMNGEGLDDDEKLMLLESMGQGVYNAMPEDEPIEDEPKEDEIMLSKATASDDAEDRLADSHEETTSEAVADEGDNMKQIVRAVTDAVVKAVDKRLQTLASEVGEQGKAITGILDGLGALKEIEKSVEEKPIRKAKPVVNMDFDQVIDLVRNTQGVQSSEDEGGLVESFEVRKSAADAQSRGRLTSAVGAIFGVNNNQNGRF